MSYCDNGRRVGLWAALLLTLAFAGPAWAQAKSNVQLYGGIEIGAKGIRAVVVRTTEVADRVFEHQRMMLKTDNVGLGDLDAKGAFQTEAILETAKFVKDMHAEMRQTHGVPASNIMVVGSSGLSRKASNLTDLRNKIREVTKKEMRFMSPLDEVPNAIQGIIPAKLQPDAILFDVGSGGTRGGFFLQGSQAQVTKFSTFEFPIGTMKLAQKSQKNATDDAKYFAEVLQQCKEQLTDPLRGQLARRPAIVNRKVIYIHGGAIWALATIVRPQDSLLNQVELQPGDIATFRKLLKAKPGAIPSLQIPAGVKDLDTRKQAESDYRAVRDAFTWEQMVAGGEILHALSTTCRFENSGKRLFFRRDAHIAWIGVLADTNGKFDAK